MAAIPSMSTNSRGRNAFRSQWINAYKFFRLVCQSIPGNCFLKENQLLHGVLITEKVSFNLASEASYVYILNGQKLIKNAKNAQFVET